MSASPEHVELVKRNLALVADITSAREAAGRLGVAPQKLIDWRKGKIGKLRGEMPSKLSTNLENGLGTKRREIEGMEGNAEFWRRYDAIEALPISELAKVHKVDSLAAAIRALVQDKDADAARARTRLMESEVEAGRERTRERQQETKREPKAAPVVGAARKSQASKRTSANKAKRG